ncbi:MAG: hypothetical protein WKI04_14490 [Ferruginibacter sp.]
MLKRVQGFPLENISSLSPPVVRRKPFPFLSRFVTTLTVPAGFLFNCEQHHSSLEGYSLRKISFYFEE